MNEQDIARSLIEKCLLEAYFRRMKQEKLGKTPQLTAELDLLELAIDEIKQQSGGKAPAEGEA